MQKRIARLTFELISKLPVGLGCRTN